MSLLQIVYISTAKKEYAAAELESILKSSVRHNEVNGITGLLLYVGGTFMQVIEGEDEPMRETYGRIKADTRHYNLMNLVESPIAEREFSQWHMALRTIDSGRFQANPQLIPLVSGALDAAALKARPGAALEMLQEFSQS